MDLGHRGLCHSPLIPDLVVCCAPPHVHVQGLACRAVDRLLEGKVDGEPAKHVGRVRGRVCTQMYLQGQLKVELACLTSAARSEYVQTAVRAAARTA